MFKTDLNGEIEMEPFDFYWRGKKDKKPNTPWYHEPGIMDGGAMVMSSFKAIDSNHGILKVFNGHDSFINSYPTYGIEIPVEKCKHYIISWNEKGLPVCDQPFTEIEMNQPKKVANITDLTPNNLLRIYPTSNPITVRDKIFNEFAKKAADSSITYVKGETQTNQNQDYEAGIKSELKKYIKNSPHSDGDFKRDSNFRNPDDYDYIGAVEKVKDEIKEKIGEDKLKDLEDYLTENSEDKKDVR